MPEVISAIFPCLLKYELVTNPDRGQKLPIIRK